ncbi:MAG: 6-phosphofructokinase [Clostridia bacterium]|nr:6-phosphofructokinase [Clostridia bacterium]
MKKFRRIGVLTSGGDAPGMNAAVRAVARAAISSGVEVMGIYRGYSGLLSEDIRPLDIRDVSNIINRGGTVLYSDRCPEFKSVEGQMKGVEVCRSLGIDGIVAIGGDGTFRGATDLTNLGIPCIGIPGTIDNDITSTDSTIGYATAMNTVVDLVDMIRDTSESHARCAVVEVMGRGAGDIALNAGIASGATGIVIPEFDFDKDELFCKMKAARQVGKRNFIVLVSEALGSDYGPALTEEIESVIGIESRFVRPAHVIRGGSPVIHDRTMATRMGVRAVDELLKGNSKLVICERRGEIVTEDINYALVLDKMYKNKLTDADLLPFSEEEISKMRARVDEKHSKMQELYEIANRINL